MTTFFPIPNAAALACDTLNRPAVPLRSLAQMMARRMILANVTDTPISLAQFNVLMASCAPQQIKQSCLMHGAQETLCDPLNGITMLDGSTLPWQCGKGHAPSISHLMPAEQHENSPDYQRLVRLTTNTILNQLSSHGNAQHTALPIKRRIKPLAPELAAWEWAEAMEQIVSLPAERAFARD